MIPRACLLFALTAAALGGSGAIEALKLIPADAAKRLVRIEAREASPEPERWYLLVHDPGLPRGLREFVVADGKLVTSRTLSQFADTLQPSEIIGADAVKVDSAHVTKLAKVYTEANGAKLGTLNYELVRDDKSNAPVWKATVLDPIGDQVGVLAVNATTGAVLSADGFEKSPAADLLAPPSEITDALRAAGKKTKGNPPPKPTLLKRLFGGDSKRKKAGE